MELDRRIVHSLENDYRVTFSEIARSLAISRSTVKRRLNSVFGEGRLAGYQVELDRLALGLERLVYLEVKTNPKEAWLLRAIESLDDCIGSDGVIGEYGLVFKLAFANSVELAAGLHSVDPLIASTSAKRYRIVDVIETYKERDLAYAPRSPVGLDEVDRALLRILLRQEGEAPWPLWRLAREMQGELGRTVSRSLVQKRLGRLVSSGVIRQFTVRPRRWRRDPGIRAFVRLRTDPGQTTVAAEAMTRRTEILSLYRTGEEYGLFAEIFSADLTSLDRFLKWVYEVQGVIDTVTTIVVEMRKETPVPLGSLL